MPGSKPPEHYGFDILAVLELGLKRGKRKVKPGEK